MKIKNIHISNFKSLKNFDFDLKKINIILGPNNSGKSNILRLLLLLKQTFTSSLQSPLILNGNIINLGSFRDISYKFNKNTLEISYIIKNPFEIYFEYEDDFEIEDESVEKTTYLIKFEYEFDFDLNSVEIVKFSIEDINRKKKFIEYLKDGKLELNEKPFKAYNDDIINVINSIISKLKNFPKIEFKSKKFIYRNAFRIAKKLNLNLIYPDISPLINYFINYLENIIKTKRILSFSNQEKFPRISSKYEQYERDSLYLEEIVRYWNNKQTMKNLNKVIKNQDMNPIINYFRSLNDLYNKLNGYLTSIYEIREILDNLGSNLDFFYNKLYYIGPLRKFPQRYYSITGETAEDVGFKGEFFPHLLKESIEKKDLTIIFDKVKDWLKIFELAKDTDIKRYSEIQEFLSIIFKEFFSGLKVNITDMGVGTSQLLPIIIEGFFISSNSVLIIEQPEIHLHPKAQARLGDLFIDFVRGDKTLIIETHSEHLIQRIQRRISENIISNKIVNFFYITMGEDGSIIRKLEINEDGFIENIPEGFFDEDFKEAYEHLKNVINKRNQ